MRCKLPTFFFVFFFLIVGMSFLLRASTDGLKRQVHKAKDDQSDLGCSLKKAQKIASKTIGHPLVYGPSLVLIVSIMQPTILLGVGLVTFSACGFVSLVLPGSVDPFSLLLPTRSRLTTRVGLIVGSCVSLYATGCLYALKKTFDAYPQSSTPSCL